MKTRQKTAQPTDFSLKSTPLGDSKNGISKEGALYGVESNNTSTIFSNISKNIISNDEALKHTTLSSFQPSEMELKKASEL
jgi:hypothetical protein